jgi:hypothetical protein
MIVYKSHVNDYIKCPFLFGKNILSSRQGTIKIPDMHMNIKKHIAEIAAYEMKNDDKVPLAEYRTRYTNKYYTKPSQVLEVTDIVPKLNQIFEIFANNAFLGYNVPIEIPIPGTATVYRDIVDFILTDEEENIFIVEIDDLTNIDHYKNMISFWPQYYTPYSYLANAFEKPVEVILIDPNDYMKFTTQSNPERHAGDVDALCSILKSVSSEVLVKNLYACKGCKFEDTCH